MGKFSRDKGKRGERELFKILNDYLGEPLFGRNLIQSREGGADSDSQLPVAIEVKYQETLRLPAWLEQTKQQAADAGKLPVLAYRRSREPWTCLLVLTPTQLGQLLASRDSWDIPVLQYLEIIDYASKKS